MKADVRAFAGLAVFLAVCLAMIFVYRDESTKDTHGWEFAGLGVALGLCLAGAMAAARGQDRVATLLSALVFCLFFNSLTCNFPTDPDRFGYGFPWKWCYDPGYRHSWWSEDLHAVTPFGGWRYDTLAGLLDAAVAVAILGVWLFANELWQPSRGNQPSKLSEVGLTP